MNPPYGREVGKWIAKAAHDSLEYGSTIVCLLPSRTDTKWFHELVLPNAQEIRFIRGRVKFEGMQAGAPFPSLIVIFHPKQIGASAADYTEHDKYGRWTSIWLAK